VAACADEPRVADAQAVVLFTSTFWRNSWKYQARAYRHSFWDSGTVLANLLAVAAAQRLTASLVLGFADPLVNRMLGVDGEHEAAICLVALGSAVSRPPPAPALEPLDLPTRTLSPHGEIEYPAITAAHAATSLADAAAVTAWRPTPAGTAAVPPPAAYGRSLPETPSIEEVITRRGSSRRFVREPITLSAMQSIVDVATQPVASDVAALGRLTTPYLIINAVDDLAAGAYVYREHDLQPLEHGDFRRVAGYLDLGQELAADAAVNVYSLCSLRDLLTRVGDRAYRAAQLEGAVEGGRLYLAAYALDLGATGLTFFDDDVTRFFDVPDQAVMFLTALGKPRRTRGSAAR
jgi:nitroreductase